jgi:hypothetical protein
MVENAQVLQIKEPVSQAMQIPNPQARGICERDASGALLGAANRLRIVKVRFGQQKERPDAKRPV